MTRARVSEGLLAALGTLAAAWPLTTLLTGEGWLWRLILLVLLVSGLGMAARATGTARGVVVLAQITGLLLVVLVLDLQLHLGMHALAQQVADLIGDANHTLMTYPAPAPVTPGVEFVLSLIVPTLAIAVDLLAVTFRRPAAAGIPLLGVFMLSASNVTTGLNPAYFVALAVVWLSMVAHGSSRQILGWASTLARPSTPTTFENRFNVTGHAALARGLGVASLVLALILPAALPHSQPHFFANGLGRSSGSGGSGPGSMFGSEADIAKDLQDQGTNPVLAFRTNDPSPPPLRVIATTRYKNGQWNLRPSSDKLVRGRPNQQLQIEGTSTAAATHTYSLHVSSSTIGAPQLAAPFPVKTADLGSVQWGFNRATGRIVPSRSADSYSLTYERLDDDDQPSGSGTANSPNDLALPQASRARVEALAQKIGGRTLFDSAIAIQDYLRSGSFTYSLSLAPRQKAPGGGLLDPLSNFLVTRKGYCIQFATAMIMLARADGIPARMAVGFLPGEEDSAGSYHVVKSDAHAWPELWFPGMGWTRFEPTPGSRSGAPPLYAIPTQGDTASSPSPSSSAPAPAPNKSAPVPAPAPETQATTGSGESPWSTAGRVLLIVLAILVLLLILPAMAWARRRRIATRAPDRANRLEAEWTVLQSRLDDLGITPPDGRSPRALEDYYRRRGDLGSRPDDALHRAVQTLERARYAAPDNRPQTIAADSHEVIRQVRARVSTAQRVKALLVPSTGRRALGSAIRSIAGLPARLLRRQSR